MFYPLLHRARELINRKIELSLLLLKQASSTSYVEFTFSTPIEINTIAWRL